MGVVLKRLWRGWSVTTQVLVVGALVFVTASAGSWWVDDRSAFPEWLSAVATFAAFAAAAIAARYAADVQKRESNRDRARERERRRAQAELVATWMGPLNITQMTQGGRTRPLLRGRQVVYVRNASPLPVVRASLAYTVLVGITTDSGVEMRGYEVGVQELDIIPPTDAPMEVEIPRGIVDEIAAIWVREPERATKVARVGVSFFDTGDRGWIREADGRLLRQPSLLETLRKSRLL